MLYYATYFHTAVRVVIMGMRKHHKSTPVTYITDHGVLFEAKL